MELLDVVDENNNLIGKIKDKEIIHKNGIFHREIVVWIMNKNGEVLLQKRAATKKHSPNKWGLTAGHVDAGEVVENAAKREILEEIGIRIDDLKEICITKDEEFHLNCNQYNNCFSYQFFVDVDYGVNDYTIQKEELSEVKYISLEQLEEIVKNKDDNYTFSKRDYMQEVIEYLYKERENIKK